jgi:hypothetical protein
VNILRGIGFGAVNAKKTSCIHGHEFTEENTYMAQKRDGRKSRVCIACLKARDKARRPLKLLKKRIGRIEMRGHRDVSSRSKLKAHQFSEIFEKLENRSILSVAKEYQVGFWVIGLIVKKHGKLFGYKRKHRRENNTKNGN